jgi:hypothetical protein
MWWIPVSALLFLTSAIEYFADRRRTPTANRLRMVVVLCSLVALILATYGHSRG